MKLNKRWNKTIVNKTLLEFLRNENGIDENDYAILMKLFFTGLGYYTRANPEQCILGVKGKGLRRINKDVPRLIVAPRGRHSAKPLETYDRIERLFGDVRRVELFARNRRPGWDAWGNQVDGSITLPEE